MLITKSAYPQKWRAINMLASWELKRQDLKRQITNNFAIDVTNFQLMVDDIQKEAKAYREKFPGDDKASKLPIISTESFSISKVGWIKFTFRAFSIFASLPELRLRTNF